MLTWKLVTQMSSLQKPIAWYVQATECFVQKVFFKKNRPKCLFLIMCLFLRSYLALCTHLHASSQSYKAQPYLIGDQNDTERQTYPSGRGAEIEPPGHKAIILFRKRFHNPSTGLDSEEQRDTRPHHLSPGA